MDDMMKEISQYPNGTYLKVEWNNGQFVLDGEIDTIYESDNGLDEEDANYREFYACAFRVKSIVRNLKNIDCVVDSLIEISIENQPTQITLLDGSILWKIQL